MNSPEHFFACVSEETERFLVKFILSIWDAWTEKTCLEASSTEAPKP